MDGGVFRLRGCEREGSSLGRRKARWVPDTHCPRRLLLRDETSKRGRGSRARRRWLKRNGGKEREEKRRLSSQSSDGQTDGLRVLSFLRTHLRLLLLLLLLFHSRFLLLFLLLLFFARGPCRVKTTYVCLWPKPQAVGLASGLLFFFSPRSLVLLSLPSSPVFLCGLGAGEGPALTLSRRGPT